MKGVLIEERRDPIVVEAILRSLPQWFGIDSAIETYVADAARLDSFLAVSGGRAIGVALVRRRFVESAELALMAVDAGHRGRGIGRRLVEHVVEVLRRDSVALLQVRTVGESFVDDGYAQTRAFYRALGFLPLQEIDGLEWDGPTLVMVLPLT